MQDWHVFPNLVYLHSSVDGVLCYRSRPNGRNPDSCIFDVWSLVRYAPGKEPPLNREYYTDYRDCRSEEHTSELQSLMRISYAVFCLKKKRSTKYKRTEY